MTITDGDPSQRTATGSLSGGGDVIPLTGAEDGDHGDDQASAVGGACAISTAGEAQAGRVVVADPDEPLVVADPDEPLAPAGGAGTGRGLPGEPADGPVGTVAAGRSPVPEASGAGASGPGASGELVQEATAQSPVLAELPATTGGQAGSTALAPPPEVRRRGSRPAERRRRRRASPSFLRRSVRRVRSFVALVIVIAMAGSGLAAAVVLAVALVAIAIRRAGG